jgi:hypothetical protein
MVVNCGNATIDTSLLSQIYAHLQNPTYISQHRTQGHDDRDAKWFGIHSAALYFKFLPMINSERQKAFLKLDQLINSKQLHGESGLHLIRRELGGFGMRRIDSVEPCLAKNIFVFTEFKSTQLLKFATNLIQDYNATVSSLIF